MNRFQKKILTIAAGLANIGLALSAAAIATYAWFATTNPTIIAGDPVEDISIGSDGNVSLTYEIIKYDENLKEGISFQGNAENFQLQKYDRYIPYNHRYENAVIRAAADLTGFEPGDEIAIDISCSQLNSFLDGSGNVNKFTSNVIQFKSTVVSCVTSSGRKLDLNEYIEDEVGDDGFLTNAALAYETSRIYFANQDNGTSFVSYYNHTASKNHYTITNVPYLSTAQLNKNSQGEFTETITSVVIYLQCSYNENAIEYYIENHLEDGTTAFGGDITDIYFSTRQGVDGGYQKVTSFSGAGDYLAVYDTAESRLGGTVALDGNATPAQIDSLANFVPVSIDDDDVIDANTVIQKSDLNVESYDGGYSLGTDGAGYIGNDISDSSSEGIISHATDKYKNNINSDGTVYVNKSSGSTKYDLRFDKTPGNARFGYYQSTNSDTDPVNLYKYNGSYKAPVLSSISAVAKNNNNKYYVGASLDFANRFVVTAVYIDPNTGETFTDNTVAADCRLNDDIDMNTPGKQTIYIYLTKNNITVRTSTVIDILSTPFITLDRNEVTVTIGYTATLTVSASENMGANPTYTWADPADTSKATATNKNTATVTLTGVSEGDTTITVTVSGDATASLTAIIHVIPVSETKWVRVTSLSQLTNGDNIIIAAPAFTDSNHHRAAGAQTLYNNLNFRSEAEINVINTNQISLVENSQVTIFQLGRSEDYYTFSNGGNYLCSMESGNNINEEATITNNSKWSISIENGISTITAQAGEKTIMRYNQSATRFSCYGENSNVTELVSLFKEVVGDPIVALSFTGTPGNQVAGMPFNPTGITGFEVTYSSGRTKSLTASDIVFNGGNNIANGQTYLTATYTEAGYTVSVLIDWAETAVNELESITISGTLTNTTYLTGSTFNPAGLTITAHFSAISDLVFTGDDLNDGDLNYYVKTSPQGTTTELPAGEHIRVIVSYEPDGFDPVTAEVTTDLTVIDKSFDALEVTKGTGAKDAYVVGETFSLENFIIKAIYNEDTAVEEQKPITSGYTYTYTTPGGTYTSSQAAHRFVDGDVSNSITVRVTYVDQTLNNTSHYDEFTISVTSARIFTLYQESTITAGDYIITYDNYAMSNNTTDNNNRVNNATKPTVTNNQITNNSDDTIVYHIAANGNYWTLQNKALADGGSNSYLKATASSGANMAFDSSTSTNTNWTVTASNSTYDFLNAYNSRYLRNNGSYGFAAYTSTTGGALTLYKLNYTPSTVTSVTVDSTPTSNVHSVNAGQTLQLEATVNGTGSPSQEVDWLTSDSSIATVDSSGTVTGVEGGSVTITARSKADNTKSGNYSVTVTAKTTLSIDSASSTAYSNSKWEIDEQTNNKTIVVTRTTGWDANVTGQGTVASITWSSSNTSAATISGNGTLTGTITAKDISSNTDVVFTAQLGNGKSASVTVTIKAAGAPATTTVTDTINRSLTNTNGYLGNTSTSTWKSITITGSSGAEYHIYSMGIKNTDDGRCMTWNKNAYLYVSTTATDCVKIQSITITTVADKSIILYGSNSAYSDSPSSTQIVSQNWGTSGTTYNFVSNNKDYKYLGLKGNATSTYIVSISITYIVTA